MRSAKMLWVVAALGMAAGAAQAQSRSLQLDVNNVKYQARDLAGLPVAFGGTSHTGSLVYSFESGISLLPEVFIKTPPGEVFALQPSYNGVLTDVAVTINLNNGEVTGGSMKYTVSNGVGGPLDAYETTVVAGSRVVDYVGGGFKIEALTSRGKFTDSNFAGVDVSDFFAAQGDDFLLGSFLAFDIRPTPTGGGYGSIDQFVSAVPTPGTMALVGLAGVAMIRRRRR